MNIENYVKDYTHDSIIIIVNYIISYYIILILYKYYINIISSN